MKCQNCNRLEANFHYSSNINGRVTETHLCDMCAAELGYDKGFFNFGSGLFESLLSTGFGSIGLMPVQRLATPTVREPETKTIPDPGTEIRRRRELNELKARLKNAVAAEQYEKAAELRDIIHKTENRS